MLHAVQEDETLNDAGQAVQEREKFVIEARNVLIEHTIRTQIHCGVHWNIDELKSPPTTLTPGKTATADGRVSFLGGYSLIPVQHATHVASVRSRRYGYL